MDKLYHTLPKQVSFVELTSLFYNLKITKTMNIVELMSGWSLQNTWNYRT